MRALVAGPWIGEFGWELMAFQARVRALSAHYDEVVVLGLPGHGLLYADYAHYKSISLPEGSGHASCFKRILSRESSLPDALYRWCDLQAELVVRHFRERFRQVDRFRPPYDGSPWVPTYLPYQRFRRFGRPRVNVRRPLVVLVDRKRNLDEKRNWPERYWEELTRELEREGITVERYVPSLADAMRQLASADLAAGGSTGGLHLASLCGCPHFVWGPGPAKQWAGGPWPHSSKLRYEYIWNPLGTPVVYEEAGWNPPVAFVKRGILRALSLYGRTTGSALARERWRATVWTPGRSRLLRIADAALFMRRSISWRIGNKIFNMSRPVA